MQVHIPRGVGTGETGEARALPEIRGCIKSNRQEKNMSGILFFGCFTWNYTVPTPLHIPMNFFPTIIWQRTYLRNIKEYFSLLMPLLILFVFVDLLDLTSMDMVIWYWQPRVVLELFSKVLFGGKCLLAKGKFVL